MTLSTRRAVAAASVCLFVFATALPAQAPRPGGRPPGFFPPDLTSPPEETGFNSLFDGKSLSGWDGDTTFWRVENGLIVGETAADKQPKQNTFLIWRGGSPADFELKLEYKLTGHNSGIQFRSTELPDIKWAMKGYQADIDAQQRYTGQVYEERGRGFLAMRGQATYIAEGKKPGQIAVLGADAELKSAIKSDDWNSVHIIARGNTSIQIINGRVMSILIDDDTPNRRTDGLIGFQVHVGPPMRMEIRNVRLKKL